MVLQDYVQVDPQNNAYCVDDSAFVPMSEAVKQVVSGTSSPSNLVYQFKDGKDNGEKVPYDRSHRFTGDIADISVEYREAQKVAGEVIKDARTQFEREQKAKETEQYYQNLMSGNTQNQSQFQSQS